MGDSDICDFIRRNGFEVCSNIGNGGFSRCYDVYCDQYKQHFVCKAISIVGTKGEARKKSFQNELQVLTNLIHPNIIQVFKAFSNNEYVFLILEYCPNGDFFQYVKTTGPILDDIRLLRSVGNILDALSYLEVNNIAHRDIKPSNIFIDKHGRPKIADFGLASFVDKSKLCEEYNGSLVFVAPEILWRKPYDSLKADIWSFGITVFYLATGSYPFPVSDNKVLVHSIKHGIINIPFDINETIRTLLVSALQLDPNKRMSFSEMKKIVDEELKQIDQQQQTKLPPIHKFGNTCYRTYVKLTGRAKSHGLFTTPIQNRRSMLVRCRSEKN